MASIPLAIMPESQAMAPWVLFLLVMIPLAAGILVGMFYQARRHWTDRRVQQYQWEQKFRLAETDRQEAIEGYNRMGIEMKKVRGTFDGYVEGIAALESELEGERARAADMGQNREGYEQEIEDLRVEGRKLKERLATAEAASARKTQVYGELSNEHQALEEEVELLHEKARSLRGRLPEIDRLESVVKEREEELARWELRGIEIEDAQAKIVAALEARIGELLPYPARLAESESTRAQGLIDHEAELRVREARAAELERRLAELEPVPLRLAERDRELARAIEEGRNKDKEKGELYTKIRALEDRLKEIDILNARLLERDKAVRTWEERHTQLVTEKAELAGSLQERIKSLEHFPDSLRRKEAELAEREESLAAAHGETRRSEDSRAELELEVEVREEKIGSLHARIAELEGEIASRDGDLAQIRAELDESIERIGELEPYVKRSSEREEAYAALDQRFAELASGKETLVHEFQSKLSKLQPLTAELAGRERTIAEWEKRCEALERRAEVEHERQEKRYAQVQEKLGELRETRKEIAGLQKESLRSEKALKLRDEQLSLFQQKLSERENGLRTLERRLETTETERAADKKRVASLQAELAQSKAKLEANQAKLEETRKQARGPETKPAAHKAGKTRTVVLQPHPRQAARSNGKAATPSKAHGRTLAKAKHRR